MTEEREDKPIGAALAFVVAPLLTFLAVAAAGSLLRHQAPLTYYQTVAFLVPSLLVTLAVQGQFFRVSKVAAPPPGLRERHPRMASAWGWVETAGVVGLLVYLALGEFAALLVLATEDPGAVWFGVSLGSVATAFVAIGVVALLGTPWSRPGGDA